jgi:hypothetical protein
MPHIPSAQSYRFRKQTSTKRFQINLPDYTVSQPEGQYCARSDSYIAVKQQVPYPYKTEVPCNQTTSLSEHSYGYLSTRKSCGSYNMRHWTWLAKLSQLFSQITCRSLTMMDCHIISGRSYRQRKGTSETDICSRDPQYRHTVDSCKPWLKRLRKFLGLLNPKVHHRIHKFRYLTIL